MADTSDKSRTDGDLFAALVKQAKGYRDHVPVFHVEASSARLSPAQGALAQESLAKVRRMLNVIWPFAGDCSLIVTNVGGLPALVPHEKAGLVCEPTPSGITAAISRYFQLGEDYFIPHLREEKKKYSWEVFVKEIMTLSSYGTD